MFSDLNKIGSEGCVRIVQSLREHKKLKVLDLGKYICLWKNHKFLHIQ